MKKAVSERCNECTCRTCGKNPYSNGFARKYVDEKQICIGCRYCMINDNAVIHGHCQWYESVKKRRIVEMIKKIAFDDKNGKEIDGPICKLAYESIDVDGAKVECDEVKEILDSIKKFDFSFETAKEIVKLINSYFEEQEPKKPKKKKQTTVAADKYDSPDDIDVSRFVTLYNAGFDVDKLAVEFFKSKEVIRRLIDSLKGKGVILE